MEKKFSNTGDVKPCKIAQLELDKNIEVTGLVIGKQEKRTVTSVKNPIKQLNVMSFIIRDSIIDFLMVNCWGTSEFIDDLCDQIHISDSIVRIKSPLVKMKNSNENQNDQIYKPWTPSSYELSVTEKASIEVLDDSRFPDLVNLKNIPVREHNDYFTLEDIISNSEQIVNQEVNLLFVVREMEPVTEIKSRNGRMLKKLELYIFDNTHPSMKLTMWDNELIKFASNWTPMQLVVFAVGLKIIKNEYSKDYEAVTTSRTIFTLNPKTSEGYALYNYAKKVNLPPINSMLDQMKNNAIKCTIEELKKKISEGMYKNEQYFLLNAVVTDFNIDFDSSKFYSIKCKRCNVLIDKLKKACPNRNCINMNYGTITQIDTPMSLSDHTSTISNVRMGVKLFQKIFEVDNLEDLDQDRLTKLKWKILMERKSCFLKVVCQSSEENDETFMKYSFKLLELEDQNNS